MCLMTSLLSTAAYAAAVLFRMSEDKPPDYRHRLSSNLHQLYHNEVSSSDTQRSCVVSEHLSCIVGLSIGDDDDATTATAAASW